ncbi:coagulation factor X-like [Cloeon dipterum]|uniref:coagulation factor X-like n=1 Tax=Cloeon dipterum TaxID=197152 RepID=UPI00322048BB
MLDSEPNLIFGMFSGTDVLSAKKQPWHAYIENEVTGATCGGTLISPTAVLTAAHCIHGSEADDFIVIVGMYDITQIKAKANIVVFRDERFAKSAD